MANSFLSSDQKLELSNLLQTMREDKSTEADKDVEIVYIRDKDSISSKYNSLLLAMMTFSMIIFMTVYISLRKDEFSSSTILKDKLPLFLAATAIPIVLMMTLYTFKMIKDRETGKKELSKKHLEKMVDEANIS